MPEARFPTLDEFWRRLGKRDVEHDLRDQLRERTSREHGSVLRLGSEETVVAAVGRMIPGKVPARALAVFLDGCFDRQLGRGDDKAGVMERARLIPAGFVVLDAAATASHGTGFAALRPEEQDELLRQMEEGGLEGPEGFDGPTWFTRTRGLLLLGYGSDPRGMVEMGFPGPSYKPGHLWLDEAEVEARARRKRGYLGL